MVVFISRDLDEDSAFHTFANKHQLSLHARSLISFQAIPFTDFAPVDWIFFYSKNAVRFFFQRCQYLGIKPEAKIGTMGLGTLNALKEFGRSADFAGNGDPQQVAEAFKILAKGQAVLFPRAKNSRKSIQKLLKEELQVHDLVVYENNPMDSFTIPRANVLIFTSPLNVNTYFKHYQLEPQQQIIAIGNTSAKALNDLGIASVHIAKEASEKGLLKSLGQIIAKG